MLKTRIIPTLLWKDTGLVKGISFDSWRRVGTLLPAIKVYNTRQVDEIILLDISATENCQVPDYETINDLAAECFVPLTVGGGITSVEQIRELLKAGADKVSINSALYENPELIREASSKFGKQCIVASIDAKFTENEYFCYSHCGGKKQNKQPAIWAKELEQLGAGEILITSIDNDGTMNGYDLELTAQISHLVDIPVIASGGAGNYKDVYDVLVKAKATAAAMASIFHFTEQTPMQIKNELGKLGVLVRDINKNGDQADAEYNF